MSEQILHIKELDLDIIPPNIENMYKEDQGGQKTVVIGKPGSGKTTLIKSLLYHKKHIFPAGMVMSGTEDSNATYSQIFPSSFVFNELDENKVQSFIDRQKLARKHIRNPWSILLLDDCTDDSRIFKKKLFQSIFKNGRHWKAWFIISLQFAGDLAPVIRTNIDGTFILREPNLQNRKRLWENYAGIIPDFPLFCEIMDQITDDHTALYIHNATKSNKMEECIFWYKADHNSMKNFKIGCPDYWNFHKMRHNPDLED